MFCVLYAPMCPIFVSVRFDGAVVVKKHSRFRFLLLTLGQLILLQEALYVTKKGYQKFAGLFLCASNPSPSEKWFTESTWSRIGIRKLVDFWHKITWTLRGN